MANTFNGMTADNIARLGITTLEKALVPMSAFTLNLSPDIQDQGTTVSTRIVPAAAAPTDLVNDESGSYSSVVDDQTTTAVQVILDQHPVSGFALTDSEAQEIAAGVWRDTGERLVKSYARGIANDILNDIFNLVTVANFGAAVLTTAAANFDADDVADLREEAVNAGFSMDDEPALLLTPAYFSALLKGTDVKDFSASQLDALRTGNLPRLSGFKIIEAPTFPPVGGTPETENAVGFIAMPDAIAIAMRGVDTQDRRRFISYEVMESEVVGAILTVSSLWTEAKRQVETIFETRHGVKKAQGASLKIIASA